jgi:two-component SAPR family response regulator
LPSNIVLVLNGRNFSYYPWNRMVQAGTAIVLGEEQALAGGIFSATETERPHIEVYGFGSGIVQVNGLPVDTWDGPLPRNLFYYFVDHPMVTRDEIFETFWPDLNTKEATNVFHVTKRKISERLGYELTNYSGGFYRPSNEVSLHYDVQHFEENYRLGRGKQDKSNINDWYNVIKLYRSEFLHELDMSWINERRDALRDMYAEALINVARMHQSARDFEKAIHYFLRGLREQPLREDIYRALMTIYHQQGEHRKALELYKTLEEMLYRKLKIKPSSTTIQLYNIIENETP